jgi:endonuclease/exonuclease/phosphatase family protein
MAFIRDARSPGGLELAEETPIVVLGDMNMVGLRRQLNTLLTGEIVNTRLHGPAFAPDWDGTALADLKPPLVADPANFTWYDTASPFHPGRLDYLVFSDSVLEPGSRFVLFTPTMHPDSLSALGLEADDATIASDHMPVVGDLRYTGGTNTAVRDPEIPGDLALAPNYPNPFRTSTRLTLRLPVGGPARLTIHDILGREVAVLFSTRVAGGVREIVWDATGMPSGTYFYRLQTADRVITRPMLLLR